MVDYTTRRPCDSLLKLKLHSATDCQPSCHPILFPANVPHLPFKIITDLTANFIVIKVVTRCLSCVYEYYYLDTTTDSRLR